MKKALAKSIFRPPLKSGSETNMAKSKYLTKFGGNGEFIFLFSIRCMLEIFHLEVYRGLQPWGCGIFFFLCAETSFLFFSFSHVEIPSIL